MTISNSLPDSSKKTLTTEVLILLVLLSVTCLLYLLGLPGPFLLDDFHNLSSLSDYGGIHDVTSILRYVTGESGLDYSRSLARLTFVLNANDWPNNPQNFKMMNIVIHLLTGLMIYLLFKDLLKESHYKNYQFVSLLTCAFWLLHPLHVSTTLYVVQRMAQLMVFFFLTSLYFYLQYRKSNGDQNALIHLSLSALFALLSFLSKESAVQVLLIIPLVEFFFYTKQPSKHTNQAKIISISLVFLFSVLFVGILYLGWNTSNARTFTPWERLAIEGKILFKYLYYWIAPASKSMTLLHDDENWMFVKYGLNFSAGYWIIHLFLISIAVRLRKKYPLISFGILWFYLTHLVESTLIPLELMYEHRNYLAFIGLALASASAIEILYSHYNPINKRLSLILLIVFPLLIEGLSLAKRTSLWSNYTQLTKSWATNHPLSFRSQISYATTLENNPTPEPLFKKLEQMEQVFNDPSILLYKLNILCLSAKPNTNVDEQEIYDRINQANFSPNVLFRLQQLLNHPNQDCVIHNLPKFGLNGLINHIAKMKLLKEKTNYYLSFLDIASNHAISQKNYELSISYRQKAFSIAPKINNALKLSELFIVVGDYQQAQKLLYWATIKNNQRWYYDSVVNTNLENLQQALSVKRNQHRTNTTFPPEE